ncbi:hypothetical protein LguiA_027537 [Lonicera macranthoides]
MRKFGTFSGIKKKKKIKKIESCTGKLERSRGFQVLISDPERANRTLISESEYYNCKRKIRNWVLKEA